MAELSVTETDRILRSAVSPRRVTAFSESFRSDRARTAITEALFKATNSFKLVEERPLPQEVTWSGFNLLLQKAPFTDLQNWSPYRSWDFAVALEQHLLGRLEQILREAVQGRQGEPITRDAKPVLQALEGMAYELEERGYSPSVFIIAGQMGSRLAVDLQMQMPSNWESRLKEYLGTGYRLVGVLQGLPILDIPESPMPSLYAADLGHFATLTRYGKEPVLEIEEISAERAIELLSRNPELVAQPQPGPLGDAERVRSLRMKVGLKLFETYDLTVHDYRAIVGAPLVGPIAEWQPEYSRNWA